MTEGQRESLYHASKFVLALIAISIFAFGISITVPAPYGDYLAMLLFLGIGWFAAVKFLKNAK